MRRLSFSRLLHRCGWLGQYVALIAATTLGSAQKAGKPETFSSPFWGSLVKFGQDYVWLIPVLGLLGLASKIVCDYVGQPWVWDAVHKVIDKFAEKAFEATPGAGVHENRVTLFRHTWAFTLPWRGKRRPGSRWRWPWSGWLVPVVRSGHATQNTTTLFLAPDDAYNAEGIAGQTWARRQVFQTLDLPDVMKNPTEENIRDYATKTFVSEIGFGSGSAKVRRSR